MEQPIPSDDPGPSRVDDECEVQEWEIHSYKWERHSYKVRREIPGFLSVCFVVESKGEIPEVRIEIPGLLSFCFDVEVMGEIPDRKKWVASLLMADVWKMDALLAAGVKKGWCLPGITSYAAGKLKEMLNEYVSTGYTPDTSKLKQYLQAISADDRFELLKKKYGWFGDTALHKAAERGDTEVMRCLLEMVEPQKRYELLKIQDWWSSETPLHVAASSGRTEAMKCMLEMVEPKNQIQLLDIPNKSNNTALDTAKGEETVQLIRQYRASAVRETADKMSPREYLSYVHNDLSLEERESLMSHERLRSKTFLVNWPHDRNLSGVKMAQAGFYCVDDYDRVQCAFCRGSFHKWEVEDNPMTEHAKAFPFCRFVKGLDCGYKEYKNDLLLADELKNITLLTMPEMKKNRDGSVSINSSAFGISTNKAAAIKYAPYETEKNTYGRWPAANVIRPEPLFEAAMEFGIQPGRIVTADSGPPSASCKTCYKKTSQVVQAMVVGLPCGHLIYSGKCIQDEKLNMDRNNAYKASHLAHQHYGGMETTCLVPDNLKWIFNPSLHGISSAVPPPPSYLTDVLCYAGGHFPDTRNPLSMDLLQKLDEMSPKDYCAVIHNDLSTIQLHWLMSMEMQRRKTFYFNWPHAGSLSGERMAEAGFYHSGGHDSVRCVFCGVVFEEWNVGDNPITEHKKFVPSCWFIQSLKSGIMGCPTDKPTDTLPQPTEVPEGDATV